MRRHRRLPNPRRVKIHRSYSVEEVARLLDVHKNTVREWRRRGLPTMDEQRPLLILGRDLAAYLVQRRRANKRPCQPGEIYCVRCRKPQRPAGDMADYLPLSATGGNLEGICPACDSMIYRRVSYAGLKAVRGDLAVSLAGVLERIDESSKPSVNSDFGQE
ncbi:MAG: helix-turn-helix domain-containing protein [Gammaproteobacteria bacterium]|nr:helix-turn-helix domain-containing protein [Gammaproteobacteria bacterium]